MTQEQKQFIKKVLLTGIPAIAKAHVDAIEEVARIAETKQEDLNGQEDWEILNQLLHENIVSTLRASAPFMADEYIGAYYEAINIAQAKFTANKNERLAKEQAEKKAAEDTLTQTEGDPANNEESNPTEKKKKSA